MKLLMLFLTVSTAVFAQETIKMQVKEQKVPCTGVAPMECLEVKIGKEKEWTYFYDGIEGFDYEPGYIYRLKVEKTKRSGVIPADASAYTYKLKKVVSKKKVKSAVTNNGVSYVDKKMVLTQLNGKNIASTSVYMTLKGETGMINGKSGCNSFGASYKLDKDRIQISRGMGTLMACDAESMKLENDFLKALEQQNFTIETKGNAVTFLNSKKEKVMVFEVQDEKSIWSFINGKKWKLIQMDRVGKDYGKAYITFDVKNQKVYGNGGCNNFFGTFSTADNNISFSGLGSTRMACMNDESMHTEGKIMEYLSEKTVSYDVADQTLNFYVDNKLVLMYGLVTE